MSIEKVTLGRTGIIVPRLCLGSLQGSGYSPERDKTFVRTLKAAFEHGLYFIDTAEGYGNGHAESLVARAIGASRGKYVIASKFSHSHSTPSEIRRALEATLRRFKTDYIDLYQQHWPPTYPALEVTIMELEKLKQEGKIRAVGVCNWMEPEFAEVTTVSRIDVLQSCYSLLWRTIEPGIIPLCFKEGISIITYSPLCQGILAGAAGSSEVRTGNRFASTAHSPAPLLNLLGELADNYKKTRAQVALRWVLEKTITAPIIGLSNIEQLHQAIGAFGWSLSAEEVKRLDEQSAPYSAGIGPHESLWNWHSRRCKFQ